DDVPITDVIENWNETHTMLHFTIALSQHKIEIIGTSVIPEFSSPLILALFITATILIVILHKKDSHRNHRQHKKPIKLFLTSTSGPFSKMLRKRRLN
ncbi:MAG: hypothetical protein QXZ02_05335, partial [Candidatus Bathyarchaeia archaeon]